jgi:hypothetical protein
LYKSLLVRCGKEGKADTVTGHGRPKSCETPRPEHFLENRLTDGSEMSTFSVRVPSGPMTTIFILPCIHVCVQMLRPVLQQQEGSD